MSSHSEREAVLLEIGLATALAVLVGGLGMLVLGGAWGGARRRSRRHEGPPAQGSVPDERHQHTAAMSAR